MGVDLYTYRVRIGSFVSCRQPKNSRNARFGSAAAFVRSQSPRPTTLLLVSLISLILLRSGDVESNPGPKIDDVLALINQLHEETTATLTEIRQDIRSINSKICTIEENLSKMPQIETKCENVGDSVREVKTSIAKVNEELFDVVDDMNNRMRRNNLIVKGIAETAKEGYEQSEKIVKEFFATHLGIQAGDIERAHRLGKRRPNFDRPIIVKFLNFKSKMDVLRNAPKLKKLEYPKVWLDEDYSPKVQLARKKLRDFAKSTRTENESYSIRFNHLSMRGTTFRYESTTDSIVEVPARFEDLANETTTEQSDVDVTGNHQPLTT